MTHFTLLVIFSIVLCKNVEGDGLQLKQVLLLSRHNVRTPLTANLDKFSPKAWTKWDAEAGELTEKGVKLENGMGFYFASWLADKKLIEGCPKHEEVFVYANTKTRTVATAQAFVNSAFKDCNVSVNFKQNTTQMDPKFNPIFHNTSNTFMKDVIKEMNEKLKERDLTEAYSELGRILNLNESIACKEESICDFNEINNTIISEVGEEPNIEGPLAYGSAIVDSFVMSYFEGKPMEEVAWGEIQSPDQWKLLTEFVRENQNVRFNISSSTKDLAGPLLNFMFEMLNNNKLKFTLLVGHDSNLNSVINALDFKRFELPNQYEPLPIGGKVVFQRWSDGTDDFLKVEYVYQSFSDLRNGTAPSLLSPPIKVLMELKSCNVDENGFCPWNDFIRFFGNVSAEAKINFDLPN